MIVYLDGEFKCHAREAEGLRAVDSTFFDGKCDAFIEGYRFIPAGESWVRGDGVVFRGEMLAPHRDFAVLLAAQLEFEEEKRAEYEQFIHELYEEVTA